MRPEQALDKHGLLLELLAGQQPLLELLDVVAKESGGLRNHPGSTGVVARQVVNHLRAGETYHVDAAVRDLIRSRAERLREVSRFGEYPPPTPCGLLVFDEPLHWQEAAGPHEYLHMVSWGPAMFSTSGSPEVERHGTIIVFWNDARRDEDEVARQILGDNDQNRWEEVLRWTGGMIPSILLAELPDMRLGPWLTARLPPVPDELYRDQAGTLVIDARDPVTNPYRVNPVRVVCAIWQLMDETITVLDPGRHIERHFRKRAERRRIKPRVTVVTLRRTDATGLEGSRGPLTERHRVRGHWRRYWVGSGADRRQVRYWVNHHLSPKDPRLPMAAETTKVYDLRR